MGHGSDVDVVMENLAHVPPPATRIAPSPGVLLAALHASEQGKGLICPAAQGSEAAWAGSVEVVAAPDLLALLNHLRGLQLLPAAPRRSYGSCRRAAPGGKNSSLTYGYVQTMHCEQRVVRCKLLMCIAAIFLQAGTL